jgi:hypothetical protein
MEFGVIHVVVSFLILVVFALVKKWFEVDQARMEAVQRCLRSEFREAAKTFTTRQDMLDYIKRANFPHANAKADLSDQGTAAFLSDHSSDATSESN